MVKLYESESVDGDEGRVEFDSVSLSQKAASDEATDDDSADIEMSASLHDEMGVVSLHFHQLDANFANVEVTQHELVACLDRLVPQLNPSRN